MASGRGRLSSLDLVPEEGQEDIRWAYAELNKRERTAAAILEELNGRLVEKGLVDYIISKSAFNRASVARHRAGEIIKLTREVFAGIGDNTTPEDILKGDVALGEFIKACVAQIISLSEGRMSSKQVMELSRAFQSAVSAQKQSTDRKTKAEKDEAEKASKTADAVATVAREAGLSADQVAKIRRDVLGVRS